MKRSKLGPSENKSTQHWTTSGLCQTKSVFPEHVALTNSNDWSFAFEEFDLTKTPRQQSLGLERTFGEALFCFGGRGTSSRCKLADHSLSSASGICTASRFADHIWMKRSEPSLQAFMEGPRLPISRARIYQRHHLEFCLVSHLCFVLEQRASLSYYWKRLGHNLWFLIDLVPFDS